MQFDFDPVKSHLNFLKHGFDLAFAQHLEWDEALIWTDLRRSYFEVRMSCFVPRDQQLFFVAFVDRGSVRRIISLRKANSRELKRYVENT
jgi:uncharacterized DUF497 family protein